MSTFSEVETVPTVAQDPIQTFVGVIATGLVNAATAIVNLLLSPFLAASPLGPAQPLTLWEVLGTIVRQVRYSYFNDAPVVPDQDITLVLGPTEVSGPINFLASDPDSDRLIYEVPSRGSTNGPQHGTVTIDQATGTFTYDPDDGYTGPDEFTVEVDDHTTLHFHGLRSLLFGRSHTDTATISTHRRRRPQRRRRSRSTTPPTPPPKTPRSPSPPPESLGNDTDPDGDPLTAVLVTGPTHGTLTLNRRPAPSPTPRPPDFAGTDTFTYTATDAARQHHTATVTITVTNVDNDAPTAVNDTATVDEDIRRHTAIDRAGQRHRPRRRRRLTVTAVADAADGTVGTCTAGAFTYTPTAELRRHRHLHLHRRRRRRAHQQHRHRHHHRHQRRQRRPDRGQ